MPWNRETAEYLKDQAYKGNFQEFYTAFEDLKRNHTPPTVKDYLIKKYHLGYNLLHWAICKESNEKIIQYIINESKKLEVDYIINQPENQGITPLVMAVNMEYIHNVKILVKNGANWDIKNKEGTLLHLAAQRNNEDLIAFLISLGIKKDFTDENGVTPLHVAAEYSIFAIHALVKYGNKKVNLNAQDNKGDTPLHYSITGGKAYNTTYLLRLGADSTISNNNNKTAFQIAESDASTKDNCAAIIDFNPITDRNPEAAEEHYLECIG